MHVPETIPAGDYEVNLKSNGDTHEITIASGALQGETITIKPMGTTKAPHEESKKRRKMAAKSRKVNRRRK